MWFSILFGLGLIFLSGVMLIRHRAAWQSRRAERVDGTESNFLWCQHRRRRHATVLIGIVGLAITLGAWITDPSTTVSYWLEVVYWLAILSIVCWMAWLAILDLSATRAHYGVMHRDHLAERARLEAELHEIRRRGSNGKPKQEPQGESE